MITFTVVVALLMLVVGSFFAFNRRSRYLVAVLAMLPVAGAVVVKAAGFTHSPWADKFSDALFLSGG